MKKLTKSGLAAALLAAFATLPLHASAGVFDDDEARKAILDLRAKVDTLAQQLNARIDTKADKSSTLDLVNQNEVTLQQINQLRGQVEVLANELANAQKRQKDFYVDLDNRLRKLEPRDVTIDGKSAKVDPAEQKAYDAAMLLFKAGDYKTAGVALAEFVRQYPESGYAANAQYWLGNAYYAQRDCKNAIAAQRKLLAAWPDSNKAPDALLSIASAQETMGDRKSAQRTLEDLLTKYPKSGAAASAKHRLAAFSKR